MYGDDELGGKCGRDGSVPQPFAVAEKGQGEGHSDWRAHKRHLHTSHDCAAFVMAAKAADSSTSTNRASKLRTCTGIVKKAAGAPATSSDRDSSTSEQGGATAARACHIYMQMYFKVEIRGRIPAAQADTSSNITTAALTTGLSLSPLKSVRKSRKSATRTRATRRSCSI